MTNVDRRHFSSSVALPAASKRVRSRVEQHRQAAVVDSTAAARRTSVRIQDA